MRTLGSTYPIILALIVFQAGPIFSLSDRRLCADPNCQGIISFARASLTYTAAEKGMVSFKINSQIRVKSKSAGSDPSLWGIEVNGRQGYAPKKFMREDKILVKDKDLKYEVAVEPVGNVQTNKQVNVPKANLNPSEVDTEVKTKETATESNETPPLKKKENDAALNASEIDLETTTTSPLTEPIDAEVVNKSLKETATPVLNKVEIIDGTAIPVIEDVKSETAKEKIEEKATTTNEAKELKGANENVGKLSELNSETKEATPKSELELEQKADSPDLAKAEPNEKADNVDTKIQSETNSQSEKIENLVENLDTSTQSNNEIEKNVPKILKDGIEGDPSSVKPDSEKADTLKLADAVIEMKNGDNKIINETNSQSKGTVTDDIKDAKKESNSKQEGGKTSTERNDDKLKEAIKKEKPNKLPNDKLKKGSAFPAQKKIVMDAYDDDDEDDYDEEDDEDMDDDEELENDNAEEPNFKPSRVELTTNTPQQVTESGFQTASNLNYWEDNEVDATTPSPVESKPTEKPAKTENQQTIEDSAEGIENINKLENTMNDTQKTDEVNPITAQEVPTPTATAEPVVTTALPIFQQPSQSQEEPIKLTQQDGNQEPIKQEATATEHQPIYDPYQHIKQQQQQQPQQQEENSADQSNERLNYENPNDYYRLQAEQTLNNDPKTDSTEATTSAEAETTQSSEFTGNLELVVADSNVASSEEKDKNLGTGSIEMITTPSPVLPSDDHSSEHIPIHTQIDEKRDAGLFGTILGTVNTFVNKLRKPASQSEEQKTENMIDGDDELQRILYPDRFANKLNEPKDADEFCEQLSPHHCPKSKTGSSLVGGQQHQQQQQQECSYDWTHINMDNFVEILLVKAFEMRELLSCLAIASSTILLFLFGYYCFCNSNREGALISKLNLLERSLLASHKENAILKDDLQKTRHKLSSIEDNSFGSNDMVIALKKELEISIEEKRQLEEQIHSLEKELETAAEAGLELNKIVAELISNQSGQESMIMNSVEDLQLQFNEQQKTILEINANLAEKSRENSELQLMLAEQNVRFSGEIASLQQDNDELEAEKSTLQTRLSELRSEFDEDITKALEGKNVEIKRLQNEIIDLKNRFEDIHTKWQTSLAKIEALEDCMKTLKKDSSVNIADVINVANVRAELLDLQKQRSTLKNRLDTEAEARQHAELSLQSTIAEVDKLKQDFHQSEKDKLEAQTRLEVLSNYFKEKETQLQKELSLKEAIWLKQQGENTSTVDRLTTMQEEIQSLKSQNDALRAEIEAQLAAHKAQTGTLENRAHETWLAARQSERRFEEARAEAAALRRRLTELAGASANGGEGNRGNNIDGKLTSAEFNNAPSPILPPPALLDANAGSPLLGTLPPPPHQFLPFMGPPPPPFLNLPPPPFLQSVEMRPAPLGRMMSPTSGRYTPNERQQKRRGDDYYERRYDDDYDDDDDYDVEEDDYDYDDEDEQDDRARSRRPRRRSGDSEWNRDNFSPPPPDRSYRSHSPTDSRYNYTYDDETDLSPPPSPPGRHGGGSRTGSYHAFSPRSATTVSPNAAPERTTSSKKGIPNSDSDKSHNSARHNKKGKSLV